MRLDRCDSDICSWLRVEKIYIHVVNDICVCLLSLGLFQCFREAVFSPGFF